MWLAAAVCHEVALWSVAVVSELGAGGEGRRRGREKVTNINLTTIIGGGRTH